MRLPLLLLLSSVVVAGCTLFVSTDGLSDVSPSLSDGGDGGSDADTGAPSLDANVPDACADIAPSRLLTDGENCGACGHTCFGGGCQSGVCLPKMIVSNLPGVFYLTVDKDEIFVGVHSPSPAGIYKAKTDGSGLVRLAPGVKPFKILADASFVYGCEFDDNRTVRTPRNTPLADGQMPFKLSDACLEAALAPDGSEIFMTNGGNVRAVKIDGTGERILDADLEGAEGITTDNENVYAVALSQRGVHRYPRSGAGDTQIALAPTSPRRMAVDQTHVYWVSLGSNELRRIPKNAGPSETVGEVAGTASNNVNLGGVAVDDRYVYWVVTEGGAVLRTDKTTLVFETILSGLNRPIDVALDDKSIYVTEQDGGRIYRLAK